MQKSSAGSFTEAAAGASLDNAGTEKGTSLEENTSALQKTIPLPEQNRADACDYHACNYDAGHFA